MCTNPFKTVEDIDSVIEKLSNSNGESVTSVTRIWDNHPSRVKFISNGILTGFNPEEDPDKPGWRRQDLSPAAYVRNGSLYAMTYNQIVNKKKRLTPQTQAYIMEENRSINIDEPIDLLMNGWFSKANRYYRWENYDFESVVKFCYTTICFLLICIVFVKYMYSPMQLVPFTATLRFFKQLVGHYDFQTQSMRFH